MKFIVTATKLIEYPDSIERTESHIIADESATLAQLKARFISFESLRVMIPLGELEREANERT